MFCRCPNCKRLFEAQSKDFGQEFHCASCSWSAALDVAHLARFTIPKVISVRLVDGGGRPLRQAGLPVLGSYGYRMDPVMSNREGVAVFDSAMFEVARLEEIDSGLMDHKGDYSLNRYIRFSAGKNFLDVDLDCTGDRAEVSLKVDYPAV